MDMAYNFCYADKWKSSRFLDTAGTRDLKTPGRKGDRNRWFLLESLMKNIDKERMKGKNEV
jgi:hypothetical protein